MNLTTNMNQSMTNGTDDKLLTNVYRIVINCSNKSTLQDLKFAESSGVFTYKNTNDSNSLCSNRYIVWRAFDDLLELSEFSLNRNLDSNKIQIQFNNSLILPDAVTIHENEEYIIVLVITIITAHRFVFPHPNKMSGNSHNIASLSNLGISASDDMSSCSIFKNNPTNNENTNMIDLPNSASQSAVLGSSASFPYLCTCSWVYSNLVAYFALSNSSGSLNVIKMPLMAESSEVKVQTLDLKPNNLIGKLITGFVPSIMKGSSGNDAAINLLSFRKKEDDFLFALCKDSQIRVISLKNEKIIVEQELFNSVLSKKIDCVNVVNKVSQNLKPISMKFWWYNNDSTASLPNLIVFVTNATFKSFIFYEIVIPSLNDYQSNENNYSSFVAMNNSKTDSEPSFKFLFEKFIPKECDIIDYFVSDGQLWTLWQNNDTISLQYYTIDDMIQHQSQPSFDWLPVIVDVNGLPEMEIRSPLVTTREYYINEIFWSGHFSLSNISKAIKVLNRTIGDSCSMIDKIDVLLQEATKLVDNIIRSQNQSELNAEEYTKLEVNTWNQLYQFCLDYYLSENKPMSIFVDHQTGVKGIVRKENFEFIPMLNPIDELINCYFLYCKQKKSMTLSEQKNGDVFKNDISSLASQDLITTSALEYRLNALITSIEECSILPLLYGMSAINTYQLNEEDLLNFDELKNRMLSCSTKKNLSLSDFAKVLTDDSSFPSTLQPDSSLSFLYEDFFEKCPQISEAIHFLLFHIRFDFFQDYNSEFYESEIVGNKLALEDESHQKMNEALKCEIKTTFSNLFSSNIGLNFVVKSVNRVVQRRYKFCRDLLLFQYNLTKFRTNLRTEYAQKILNIDSVMIPNTIEILVALDYMSSVCKTPMITSNLWWTTPKSSSILQNNPNYPLTSIIQLNTSPSTIVSASKTVSFENSDLLSVLEMRDYINLNRIGILSQESVFYDAYPRANILYFFIQFSGGILTKRLMSYQLASDSFNELALINFGSTWSIAMNVYMNSVCQLLWPFSLGQFKLAEFLLGVAQYDLLERYVHLLQNWCITNPYSRMFIKGICYLVNGDGQKAIDQFKQSLPGVIVEPFLQKIFLSKIKCDSKKVPENFENDLVLKKNIFFKSQSIKLKNNPTILPNALTIFRFYTKMIQLFKRYSSPDFVIELANHSLILLNKENDNEYEQHHSTLHSILFTCYLRLGNIDQAYATMIKINDKDQKRICLRQFILNLCEKKKLKDLVRFSYVGFEEELVQILESKARTSPVSLSPNESINSTSFSEKKSSILQFKSSFINYYYILYTHFIARNNYRLAAQAMYDYYQRLNLETSGMKNVYFIRCQAEALIIARNCLKMLTDLDQCFVVKNVFTKNNEKKLKRKHAYFSDEFENEDDIEQKTTSNKINVDELACDFELVDARIRLLEKNFKEYSIALTSLLPDETVVLCITAGFYEQAVRLSKLFNLTLQPIFEGMSSKYIQLLNGVYNCRRLNDDFLAFLFEDADANSLTDGKLKLSVDESNFAIDMFDLLNENVSVSESSFISHSLLPLADRMWYLILYYLEQYERKPKQSSRLIKIVAEKLLSNGVMIPMSLIKVYKKVNCSELCKLLITYNFLSEATHLCIDYMNAFMGHGTEFFDIMHPLVPDPKASPLYLPLHIFDCLEEILEEEAEQQKLESDDKSNRLSNYGDIDSVSVVEDEIKVEQVDYSLLLGKLSETRRKLQKKIISCSNICFNEC